MLLVEVVALHVLEHSQQASKVGLSGAGPETLVQPIEDDPLDLLAVREQAQELNRELSLAQWLHQLEHLLQVVVVLRRGIPL